MKRYKKVLRLKKEVKQFLKEILVFLVLAIIFSIFANKWLDKIDEQAIKCDAELGYRCSINQVVSYR